MEHTQSRRKTEEGVALLVRRYPALAAHMRYDTDAHGNAFCELTLPNTQNPAEPLTVQVTEDGCLLSFGAVEEVTGNAPIPAERMADAMADILSDRVIFLSVYKNEDAMLARKASLCRVYRADDPALDALTARLSAPPRLFDRLFSPYRGLVTLTTFSGAGNRVFHRK